MVGGGQLRDAGRIQLLLHEEWRRRARSALVAYLRPGGYVVVGTHETLPDRGDGRLVPDVAAGHTAPVWRFVG